MVTTSEPNLALEGIATDFRDSPDDVVKTKGTHVGDFRPGR